MRGLQHVKVKHVTTAAQTWGEGTGTCRCLALTPCVTWAACVTNPSATAAITESTAVDHKPTKGESSIMRNTRSEGSRDEGVESRLQGGGSNFIPTVTLNTMTPVPRGHAWTVELCKNKPNCTLHTEKAQIVYE